MILRRLRLKHYRKFRDLDLDFPLGLLCMVGRNGSGKSTLVEAVAFALYGTAASRTGGKGIKTEGAGPRTPAEVELEFSVEGEAYRIVRQVRGANEVQSAAAYRGGALEPEASTVRGVDAWTARLLGMDHRTFIRSVFARQKEIHALSGVKPEERRIVIRRMLGIDRVDRAVEQVRRDIRDRARSVAQAGELLAALPAKRAERAELAPLLAAAEKARTRARDAGDRCKARYQEAVAALRDKETQRKAFVALEKSLAEERSSQAHLRAAMEGFKADMKALKEKRKVLKAKRPLARRFEVVRRKRERLDKARADFVQKEEVAKRSDELARERGDLAPLVASLEKELAALGDPRAAAARVRKALTASKARARALEKELRGLARKRDSARAVADKHEADASALKKAGPKGHCPLCRRGLDRDYDRVLDDLSRLAAPFLEETAEAEARMAALEASRTAEEERQKELEAEREEHGEAEVRRSELKARLREARRRLDKVERDRDREKERLRKIGRVRYDEAEHEAVREEHDRLQPEYEEVLRLEREDRQVVVVGEKKQKTAEDLVRVGDRIKRLSAEKKELDYRPAAFDRARVSRDKRGEELEKALEETSRAGREHARLEERAKGLDREIAGLQKLEDRVAEDREQARLLKRIELLFLDFRTELAARIRPLIAESASRLFVDVTRGRYARIDLDEDYEISIRDGGASHPIRRFSGGEEDLANLCLRVAISRAVAERAGATGPSFVALDEVFGSQDEERRDRILMALNALTARFQQILLITHVEEVRERVQFLLHVTEGPDGSARAVWA